MACPTCGGAKNEPRTFYGLVDKTCPDAFHPHCPACGCTKPNPGTFNSPEMNEPGYDWDTYVPRFCTHPFHHVYGFTAWGPAYVALVVQPFRAALARFEARTSPCGGDAWPE
jgi:hypothetical protein